MLTGQRRGRLFETGYAMVGLLVVGWMLARLPAQWYPTMVWLLVGAALVTPFSIRLGDPYRMPAAMPIEMTVLLVAPPAVSVAIAGWVGLCTSVWYRRPLLRTLFNIAILAVPNALAAGVLVWAIRPWPQPLLMPEHLPAAALALTVRMAGNIFVQALVQFAYGEAQFGLYLRRTLAREWQTGGFGIRILPLLMALAYQTAGWSVVVLGSALLASVGAAMRRYQEDIERQTMLDGLTAVGSRKAWEQYRRAQNPGSHHLLAMIDVDGLKETNDTKGHQHGDALLIDMAARLRAVAPLGRVFRLGGDEFVLVFPGPADAAEHSRAIEAAMADFNRHWQQDGFVISASFGLARCPAEAQNLSAALHLADQRMYDMKFKRREPAPQQGSAGN